MKNEYKTVVDTNEFQNKILKYITSDEIDKMIGTTIFKDNPDCKQAIIHGMLIASMMTSLCDLIYIKSN